MTRSSYGFHRQKKWRRAFIAELRKTGNISHSARVSGITREAAYAYRKRNKTFARKWDEALESVLDDIEESLAERAKGMEKPVFYQGERCDNGEVFEYDTTAAIFMLKKRRPEIYGDQPAQILDIAELVRRLAELPSAPPSVVQRGKHKVPTAEGNGRNGGNGKP